MKRIIIFIAVLIPIILYGDWEETYPFIGQYNEGNCVRETSDGGYIIVGNSEPYAVYAPFVIRTDNLGHVIWSRTYETVYTAKSIIEDSDGNFVFAGWSSLTGHADICVFKISSTGDSIWTRNYGLPESGDYGECIIEAIDGGFIVVGSRGTYLYSPMASILHIDPSGDTLWSRDFGGHDCDYCLSVVRFGEEGYLMAGWSDSGSSPDDYYIIRTGLRGDTLWTRRYNYSHGYTSWGMSIAYIEDERCAIVAGFCDSSAFETKIWLVKIDEWGDTIWTKTYGGSDDDLAFSICTTTDGGCAVAGETNSYGAGGSDMYVLRINSDGDTLWTRTFGGPQNDIGNSIIQTSDGGFVITGSYGILSGSYLYLVKIDPTGIVEWKSKVPLNWDISAYPNPFNAQVSITLEIPEEDELSIRVFDNTGKLVRDVYDGSVSEGTHEFIWNGMDNREEKSPSGVYYIKAASSEKTIRTKAVLLK